MTGAVTIARPQAQFDVAKCAFIARPVPKPVPSIPPAPGKWVDHSHRVAEPRDLCLIVAIEIAAFCCWVAVIAAGSFVAGMFTNALMIGGL